MGLVINTNVAALNTGRILSQSTKALNQSLQRLSSGLRINSAADDAAGLAIARTFSRRLTARKSLKITRKTASASCRRRKAR